MVCLAIDGSSAAVKLSGPMAAGGDVQQFGVQIVPDSSRVVYRADQLEDGRFELFAAPPDGSADAAISGPLVDGGDVFGFETK